MSETRLPAVYACPDGRIAVQVNIDGETWLMIDRAGTMGVARGELSEHACRLPVWKPRDAEHASDWLYERAEDASNAGLQLSKALQAVRDGFSSADVDRMIATDPESF